MTIHGKARVIVQDAEAYRRLVRLAEIVEHERP
jgi:hypothetical protein